MSLLYIIYVHNSIIIKIFYKKYFLSVFLPIEENSIFFLFVVDLIYYINDFLSND